MPYGGVTPMHYEIKLLMRSLGDFFTKPMLRLALLPFLIVGALMVFGFFSIADFGLDALKESSLSVQSSQVYTDPAGAAHTEELNATYTGSGILGYLFSNPWTSGLMSFFVYTVGGLAAAMLSIYTALAVIGFLTPVIIRRLRQKYYPQLELSGYGSPMGALWLLLKSSVAALGLFLLLIPFYFIPVVNLLAFNLPFYYLFHKQLTGDITSEMMTRQESLLVKENQKYRMRMRTLLLYLLSLLPFLWLVIPVFYVIYLANGYLDALARLRPETGGSLADDTQKRTEP